LETKKSGKVALTNTDSYFRL